MRPFQNSTKLWFKSIWMHQLCSCRYESLLSLCRTVNTPSHLHPSLTNSSSTTSEEGFCTSQKWLLWVDLLSITQSHFSGPCAMLTLHFIQPLATFITLPITLEEDILFIYFPVYVWRSSLGPVNFLLLFENVHIVRSAHRRQDFHFALIPVVLF